LFCKQHSNKDPFVIKRRDFISIHRTFRRKEKIIISKRKKCLELFIVIKYFLIFKVKIIENICISINVYIYIYLERHEDTTAVTVCGQQAALCSIQRAKTFLILKIYF